MPTVHDVANYFLAKRDTEAGDEISNMKIQKLVYYAQGFHLALRGFALFEEPIEAWRHGPVVPALYHAHKEKGNGDLGPVEGDVNAPFSDEQRELLDEVYRAYGQFSAWRLREMTHDEAPWQEAAALGESEVITHDALRRHFVELIEG